MPNPTPLEALKLAREALESCTPGDYSTGHVIHPSFDAEKVSRAEEAIAAALAAPPVPAWQTIETAPTESGLYLVLIQDQIHTASFSKQTQHASWWNAYGHPRPLAYQPTHWMPLPTPPKE